MKVFIADNKLTTKYIHRDSSETSVKLELSGDWEVRPDQLNLRQQDNCKYSMVISCTAGCALSCGFCHLTQKGAVHKDLQVYQILSNLKEALLESVRRNPEMVKRNIKLCFMGMGEPFLKLPIINEVTAQFLSWVFANELAQGVDGVDLSTAFPKVSVIKIKTQLQDLCDIVQNVGKKVHYRSDRTAVRVFYSLHHYNPQERARLIPNTYQPVTGLRYLDSICKSLQLDLIIHYMIMEDINDTKADTSNLKRLLRSCNVDNRQLRILRYNEGTDDQYTESSQLIQVLNELDKGPNKLKVQYSSGEDVQSACGMFVVEEGIPSSLVKETGRLEMLNGEF